MPQTCSTTDFITFDREEMGFPGSRVSLALMVFLVEMVKVDPRDLRALR